MANWDTLINGIKGLIKANGNQAITGNMLQSVLLGIVGNVGANATFAGVAVPTTNPGTPDGPVFYIAAKDGTYTNFNTAVVESGELAVLTNASGSWVKYTVGYFASGDAEDFVNGLKGIYAVFGGSSTAPIKFQPTTNGVNVSIPWNLFGTAASSLESFLTTIPGATTEAAGVMSAQDKQWLGAAQDTAYLAAKDGLNNIVTPTEDTVPLVLQYVSGSDMEVEHEITYTIPGATTEAAGVMSAQDKLALDCVTPAWQTALRAAAGAAGAAVWDSTADGMGSGGVYEIPLSKLGINRNVGELDLRLASNINKVVAVTFHAVSASDTGDIYEESTIIPAQGTAVLRVDTAQVGSSFFNGSVKIATTGITGDHQCVAVVVVAATFGAILLE